MNRIVMTAALVLAMGSTAMPVVAAPYVAMVFCRDHASVCRGGGAEQIVLTDAVMGVLKSVNGQVNRAIRPRVEAVDHWALNPDAGDCEDYAISKRVALVAAGIPANALRIAIGKAPSGNSHAVLLVLTDRGPLVLDNLNTSVTSIARNGIRVTLVSGGNLNEWSSQ